jgi:hypothetical protein
MTEIAAAVDLVLYIVDKLLKMIVSLKEYQPKNKL